VFSLSRERERERVRVRKILQATALDSARERQSVIEREGGRKNDSEHESKSESESERKHSKTRV